MKKKLAGLFVAVVAALIALLLYTTYLTATKGEQYSKRVLAASQAHYASTSLAYKRGDILDRNGNVLATSEKKYNVILDCDAANFEVKNERIYVEPTIHALVTMFGLDEDEIRSLLTSEKTEKSQYQVVKKTVSIEEKKAFDEYVNPSSDASITDEQRKERRRVRGVWFEEVYVRTYPQGRLAGEVLGFTYDQNKADWGIEGYYNNTLNGVDGRKYGYWGGDTQIEQTIVDPIDGDSIRTTLDVNIQSAVESTIADFIDCYKEGPFSETKAAKNIGVVVMNPNNGAIYAMASSEGYDPNNPRDLTEYYDQSQIDAMSSEQKAANLESIWRNFCISDAFEPGSVVKPVTVSAALSCGTSSEWDEYDCDGYEIVSGIKIKCSDTSGHGHETMSDAIKNSCNDALMQIGALLGIENFVKYQKIFGFGLRTGIDLSGETAGIVRSAETMGSVDLATASFGQGFTCSMIQEIAAISAVINGGYYYKPHLMSAVLDSNGTTVRSNEAVLMKQAVASDVSDLVRSYMKASVDAGTSRSSKVDGYSMGGKTGTAQKIPRGNGKYLVSFVGFAPYDDPQVVIYVVVDEPNVSDQADSRYPQWIAREILTQILPYLGIYPDEPSDPSNPYLAKSYRNPTGEINYDEVADTNVPEPQRSSGTEEDASGNRLETDGYTNEEAGFED